MIDTPKSTKSDCRNQPVVYYDGACPLCTKEIAFYRRRPGMNDAITWCDVASGDGPPASDLDTEAALARFHMRKADGELVSGARAFIALWKITPAFRWLGRVLSVPPLPLIAEIGYRAFLKSRPLIIPRRDCSEGTCDMAATRETGRQR